MNPNNIQQMAAFEVMCEEYLGVGAQWHMLQYFFRFTYLKDGSCAATIGCANLRTKQGRGDNYIPVTLTSSNSGWRKGWFYLRNDPEFMLLSFTSAPSRSRRGTGRMAPPRSRRRCSSFTGPCWGVSKMPESPWQK
jgi:hypothetical protein